jgi:multiple sugar transport system ATP-binding protein
MAFGLRRRRMSPAEIDRRVRAAAEMLNMAAYLARKPRQLSGGQRQRVALGRAIVRDPQVFLLDEPLSNLDAHLRVQMRAEILRVHQAVTATAVYVTHDQVEAMTMGDRIVVMNGGRIQQVGTPHEVYDAPVNRFVAAFIGTPAMGFITGPLQDGKVVTESAELRLAPEQVQAIGDRSRIEIGIRPERLELGQGGDWTVRGITEVVEMLGAEQYVHFKTGDSHLTARVPRDRLIRIGEPVSFTGNARHLYVFDSETGERIPFT